MKIRELMPEEIKEALRLTWSVFMEYEAPDYSREGTDNFYQCITNTAFISTLRFYGAFARNRLVGILATRSRGNHISLFFVEGRYHKKGIGRSLFERACLDNSSGKMTVHSSPYAAEVYHHLGFKDTDKEQIDGGIRYIPMVYSLPKGEGNNSISS